MKICVVCDAGMSSSLLVLKMQQSASEQNIDVEIKELAISVALNEGSNFDVIMLGPQVSFEKPHLEVTCRVPVSVINMRDYGTMNGENVLKKAIEIINEK